MTSEPLPPSSSAPAETPIKSQKKGVQLEWVRRASVLVGVALLFIVFSVLTQSFYQPANLLDILLQSSINTMIAVGMTLVVMTRGIDLSVGSVVGLSSMIAASFLTGEPLARNYGRDANRSGLWFGERPPDRQAQAA